MSDPGQATPAPQHNPKDRTIRWAIGTPGGLRSQTWSVVAGTNTDDIYVASRSVMGLVKLSLHVSGQWLLQWTKEYAEAQGLAKHERELARWDRPDEARPGWIHAVTLTIMHDRLTRIASEKRVGKVAFFPLSEPPMPFQFAILVGDGTQPIAVRGFEVGTMALPSGGMVGIVGRPNPLSPELAEAVRRNRTTLAESVTRTGSPSSLGVGFNRLPNGSIWLLDPGVIHPAAGSRPADPPPPIVFGTPER
jgi:hypothetical protein